MVAVVVVEGEAGGAAAAARPLRSPEGAVAWGSLPTTAAGAGAQQGRRAPAAVARRRPSVWTRPWPKIWQS